VPAFLSQASFHRSETQLANGHPLNQFKHCESLFGDPKAVLLTTVQPLVNDLRKTELGETPTTLEGAVDAGEAMLYDANGLFTSIGTT